MNDIKKINRELKKEGKRICEICNKEKYLTEFKQFRNKYKKLCYRYECIECSRKNIDGVEELYKEKRLEQIEGDIREETFYIVSFYHKKLKKSFYKVGITVSTVEERFKGKEYEDYNITTLQQFKENKLFIRGLERYILEHTKDDIFNFEKYSLYKFSGFSECRKTLEPIKTALEKIKNSINNLKDFSNLIEF